MKKKRVHGEGTIGQMPDGRWQGRISLGKNQDGRRIRKSIYADTKKEVAAKMLAFQRKHSLAEWVDPSGLTVETLATDWLKDRHHDKSPTTAARREQIIRLHITPHLGGFKVQQLAPMHVQRMLDKLRPDGAWTQKMAFQVLKTILNYAVKMQLIPSNPTHAVDSPRPVRKELCIYSEDEVKAILRASSSKRLHALFVLATCTGMRQGELFALSWDDVELDFERLHVRKTLAQTKGSFTVKEPKSKAGRRTIALPPLAIAALADHRKAMLEEGQDVQHGTVFVSRSGSYLQKSNFIRQVWRTVVRAAKVREQPFHSLRHSHASSLLRSGTNIRAVSKRLGHADPAMTLRVYAHVLPGEDAQLATRVQGLLGDWASNGPQKADRLQSRTKRKTAKNR